MPFKSKCYICKLGFFKLFKGYKYLLLFFCLISFRFQQPSTFDTNAKIKAVFLYNFTKYFEWPDNKKTGNFIIYVVGKNENVLSELKALASKKKVGNQDIEIKTSLAFDPAITASIIYLLPDVSKSITEVSSKNKKQGTLVVSENTGGCKSGATLNFLIVENKLKFEYSKNNAVKAGLKVNDEFKSLAINVD